MAPLELLENDSFYQLACHATDTFTSCIKIYEALLPHFEAKRPGDSVNRKLLNIDAMLNKLYKKLTTLKNEITTATAGAGASASAAAVGDNDKASKPSVKSKNVQVLCDYNQQENILSEESSVGQQLSDKEKVLKKLPSRSWEVVSEFPTEGHQRKTVDHEDNKIEQTVSQDEKVHVKPIKNRPTQSSDIEYVCGNCNEKITVYNQDLDLSVALHNQDGCCRGKPSKLIAVQKESEEKKVKMVSAQGQLQNVSNLKEATTRRNSTSHLNIGYTRFSCMKSVGNGFICTVCNKKMTGPKNFGEHVSGSYHRTCLMQRAKEIEKSEPPPNDELHKIIKHLSRSLYSQMQYVSVVEGVIMCTLCDCQIPPTVQNVKDHVLGSRHSKNQTELQSPTKDHISNNK